MNKEKQSTGGIGFTGLLAIAFIVLKLTGVISWSWVWVLTPIWISLIIVLIVIAVILIVNRDMYRKHKVK